jgi:UPF0755 protein
MTEQMQRPPRRSSKNLRASLLVVAILVGLLGGGIAIGYDQLTSFLSKFQVEDYQGEGGPPTQIVINPGDNGAAVARKLVDADVVKSFDAIYREMLNADFTIYPGTYEFPTQISGANALRILIEGKNRIVVKIVVPEGQRVQQVLSTLQSKLGLSSADLDAAIATQLERISPDAPSIEGYLFPATYTFDPNVSAQAVIKAMVDRMEAELAGYSRTLLESHELLSLAALIQAEGKLEEDFFKISRVFQNRLQRGMLLQSDPTVKYRYQGEQSNFTDGVKDESNPFNTYLYKGVPVGPVGNPGSLAIEAALRPADGQWLYFVSINLKTGETVFSETLAEHERAVLLYRQWLRDNPGWND